MPSKGVCVKDKRVLPILALALLLGLGLAWSTAWADCHDKKTDCRLEPNKDAKSVGRVSYCRCWSWKHARCQHCRNGNHIAEKCNRYKTCRDRKNGCWVCFYDNIWHTKSSCYASVGGARQGGKP